MMINKKFLNNKKTFFKTKMSDLFNKTQKISQHYNNRKNFLYFLKKIT